MGRSSGFIAAFGELSHVEFGIDLDPGYNMLGLKRCDLCSWLVYCQPGRQARGWGARQDTSFGQSRALTRPFLSIERLMRRFEWLSIHLVLPSHFG